MIAHDIAVKLIMIICKCKCFANDAIVNQSIYVTQIMHAYSVEYDCLIGICFSTEAVNCGTLYTCCALKWTLWSNLVWPWVSVRPHAILINWPESSFYDIVSTDSSLVWTKHLLL